MEDVSVQEIISTFEGEKRKNVFFSSETDDFLDLIKKKSHWTINEYKEFSLAYALKYRVVQLMDSIIISSIAKKYKFKLNWNDYFEVIENIKSIKKQKEYINYYFWYHCNDMNEEIYQQLMNKPYFKLLSPNSKSNFLTHYLRVGANDNWFMKYFTHDEIVNGLKKHLFSMNVDTQLNESSQEKEEQIKEFYNQYQEFMDNKTKSKFFYQAVKTGSISLIQFLYKDKGIRNLNKLVLLWHVCADTATDNTLEILNCLKDLGLKFNEKDLKNSQENYQWGYMEHKEQLLYFFKQVESEKNYNELDKDLKKQNIKSELKKL